MKCLVTGATGLLGSHLVIELLENKNEVFALFRNEENKKVTKGIFSYYNKLDLFSLINWIEGDMLDVSSLTEAIKEINHVYHCAATVSFNRRRRNEMLKINIEGTANIVNACLQSQVEKFCFVSSITALGASKTEINETTPWQNKTNPTSYSLSKYYSENEVWRGVAEGLKVVIVNPGIIIGPGNWNDGSAALFRKVWEGLKYYTESTTGFVDVRDVASCMEKLMCSKIENEKFIIISENLSFREILNNISLALKKPMPSIKATKLLIEFAWRLEQITSFFTHKEPVITKESVRMATDNDRYANKKIKDALNYNFIPITSSIQNAAAAFLKEHKNKL